MPFLLHAGAARRAAVILLAGTVAAAPLGTAHAAAPDRQLRGSNGQQVRACDDTGFWSAVKIRGSNQTGKPVTSPLKHLGADGCHSFSGYWWKGPIELLWYRDGSSRKGTSSCYVPANQEGNNWVLCVKDAS